MVEREVARANHRQVSASICVSAASLLHSSVYALRGMSTASMSIWRTSTPVLLHLLGFALFISTKNTVSPSTSSSRAPQMLPSSTSSTTRQPRTLRSCARHVLMAPLCPRIRLLPWRLRLRLRQPADPCHPFRPPSPPTGSPTQAPSQASKAYLYPSPQRSKAGLPPRVSPYRCRSPPACGGSCLV